jgi:hypothetical protein
MAQRSDSFDAFYSEHAPALFDLALRHGGDHTIAIDCVDTVFAALASRWLQISDPVRFCRRAAVLFVCGSRRHRRRPRRRCRPDVRLGDVTVPHTLAATAGP